MQRAAAGLVACAADFLQARLPRSELVEMFQARDILFAHILALLARHAENYARLRKQRNTTAAGSEQCAKSLPNTIGSGPFSSAFRVTLGVFDCVYR